MYEFELIYENHPLRVGLTQANQISYIKNGKDYPKTLPQPDKEQVRFFTQKIKSWITAPMKDSDWSYLILSELTGFQKKVYSALVNIPFGSISTYQELGSKVGGKHYARAVGNALNKNSFLLIFPCHRVIGSDGNLVGFACGIELKKRLIEAEKR